MVIRHIGNALFLFFIRDDIAIDFDQFLWLTTRLVDYQQLPTSIEWKSCCNVGFFVHLPVYIVKLLLQWICRLQLYTNGSQPANDFNERSFYFSFLFWFFLLCVGLNDFLAASSYNEIGHWHACENVKYAQQKKVHNKYKVNEMQKEVKENIKYCLVNEIKYIFVFVFFSDCIIVYSLTHFLKNFIWKLHFFRFKYFCFHELFFFWLLWNNWKILSECKKKFKIFVFFFFFNKFLNREKWQPLLRIERAFIISIVL